MYDKATGLPKNLRYPPFYRIEGEEYFWDRAFSELERLYKLMRTTNDFDREITTRTLRSINRDINKVDIRLARKIAKLCAVKPYLTTAINTRDNLPIFTIVAKGCLFHLNHYMWFMEFVINNRKDAVSHLSQELKKVKRSMKIREPWKTGLMPNTKSIASQWNKQEHGLFIQRLNELLEAQSRSQFKPIRKEIYVQIKNHINLNRDKLIPLTRRNYERLKLNSPPY